MDNLTNEQLKDRIAQLEGQLKSRGTGKLSLKISEKGGVSVYGMGRFPLTLYRSQWTALLAFTSDISAFIEQHAGELAEKPAKAV